MTVVGSCDLTFVDAGKFEIAMTSREITKYDGAFDDRPNVLFQIGEQQYYGSGQCQ